MKGRFLFLGTGASAGIPLIGCKCPVCLSPSPYNKRLRSSAFVELAGKRFLIDAGPDFRQQALHHKIDHIDGLLLTHTHFDHIAGIDDLRVFSFKDARSLPCLLSEESLEEIKERYKYFFRPIGEALSVAAQFTFHVLDDEMGKLDFQGVSIGYLSYLQGHMKVTGYRFGNFAYLTDLKQYDDSIFVGLKGVDFLVVSALREGPSEVHLSVEEAVAFSQKVGARRTYLTHLCHAIDHEEVEKRLPQEIRLGFDGCEIRFEA
jgi:phosphoribosyl 1,2-cyclic phosphate phosphodiesterase